MAAPRVSGTKGRAAHPLGCSATQQDVGAGSSQTDLLGSGTDTLDDDSFTCPKTKRWVPPCVEAMTATAPDILARRMAPPRECFGPALLREGLVSPSIPERRDRNGCGVICFAACVIPKDHAERARSKNNCPLVISAHASRGQVTVPVGETTAIAGSSRPSNPALVRLKSAYCLTVLCSASFAFQSTGTYPHRGNKGEQDTGNVPVSLTAA